MSDYLTEIKMTARHRTREEQLEFTNKVRNYDYDELELHGVMGEPIEGCELIVNRNVYYDEDGIEHILYDRNLEKNKRRSITQDDRIEINSIPYMIIVHKNKTINLYSNTTAEFYFKENLENLQELNQHLKDNRINYHIL